MKIIGLTGGIGSGKSTAARFLADLGAAVIDMDSLGHQALKKGSDGYKKAVAAFGEGILAAGGGIDRRKLGKIVFQDPAALRRLEKIVHPAIDALAEKKIEAYRRRGKKVVVLEAAAMLEAKKTGITDELWATTAPEATVLHRLRGRPGYSAEDVKARIRSQLADKERIKRADVVIDTDGTLDELKARVKAEWAKLQKRL